MCKCPPKLRWQNGVLEIFTCGEWQAIPGVPPAAINPNPGTLPDIFTPPDPDDPDFDPQSYACGKASAITEFLFDHLEKLQEVVDSLTFTIPFTGIEINIFELGATQLNKLAQAVLKVFDQDIGIVPDKLVALLKVATDTNLAILGEQEELDALKKEFKCKLSKGFSKGGEFTTGDMGFLMQLTEDYFEILPLGRPLYKLTEVIAGGNNKQKFAQIAQTGALSDDCSDCNPAPVDPNTLPPEPGCYRLDFERFAAPLIPSAGTGDEPSSTFTASEKGTQYAFGSYQGVFDTPQNIHWGAVILKFNEPVILNGLRFLLEWTGNDGGDIFTGVRMRRASDQMYVNISQGYQPVGAQPLIVNPNVPGAGLIDRIYISGLAFNNANFRISNVVVTFTANSVVHQNVPLGLIVCNP